MSCAVNAACLALLDSGVDMRFLIGAVCCVLDDKGDLHIDPGSIVMENAKATFEFVFDNIAGNVVTSYTSGSFSVEQYETALNRCRSASTHIFLYYRDIVAKKYKV